MGRRGCREDTCAQGGKVVEDLDWAHLLKNSPLNWLLEESNPSVRYFTLRDLLDKSENDPQVVAAKRAIADSRSVMKILAKQNPEGYWEERDIPYLPKYKSSYWQVMTLGYLGLDRSNDGVRRACEFILQFQLEEGGFSSYSLKGILHEYDLLQKKGKKLPSLKEWASASVHEHQYSCLTGNMVAALIRISYGTDARVKRALQWLIDVQNEDGGWLCPYWKAHVRDTHGCFYGTICPLEAFSEVPKESWTREMKETVERGAEFLLMHRLFKADHHEYKTINKSWLQLGFPWFSGYNILRGLDVLTKLGYVSDERLDDAVELLLQKRLNDGTWVLESTPAGRMQTNLESKGKPSKWITLIALRVLKRVCEGAVV